MSWFEFKYRNAEDDLVISNILGFTSVVYSDCFEPF